MSKILRNIYYILHSIRRVKRTSGIQPLKINKLNLDIQKAVELGKHQIK